MMYVFGKTGIGKEFFFVSASVWDSRTLDFSVKSLSSRGGPNAPRPALSVLYLGANAYGGYERQARSG